MGQRRTEFVIRVVALVEMMTRFFLSPMTNFFRSANILLLAVLSVFLSSCEKDREGAIDPVLSAPLVESASIGTAILNLDTTSDAGVLRLPDGTYRITQPLSARIQYDVGIGTLKGVYYRLYRPGSSSYFSSGTLNRDTLTSAETAVYSASISFSMNRSEAGLYRIEVFAQGQSASAGNYVQIPLRVTRNNSAPVIVSADIPDTVTLPLGGRLLITFSVAVSDSDGLGDIAGAFFYSLSSSRPTDRIVLADDGNVTGISGDAVAGDGTYTITVELVDGPNVRRTFEFEFHAGDLQGADSGPLTKFLTVN